MAININAPNRLSPPLSFAAAALFQKLYTSFAYGTNAGTGLPCLCLLIRLECGTCGEATSWRILPIGRLEIGLLWECGEAGGDNSAGGFPNKLTESRNTPAHPPIIITMFIIKGAYDLDLLEKTERDGYARRRRTNSRMTNDCGTWTSPEHALSISIFPHSHADRKNSEKRCMKRCSDERRHWGLKWLD